jgi:Putative beta-barrel porin 2/Surface lipoprotein assembly modifier
MIQISTMLLASCRLTQVMSLSPYWRFSACWPCSQIMPKRGQKLPAPMRSPAILIQPSLPDPVRQRLSTIAKGYGRQIRGGGSDISGFVDASGGYDTNINTATDLNSVTIPLFAAFGPGTLNGSARAVKDGFGEVQAGVSGVFAVGRQDRIFASALGSYHGNFSNAAFNQASATATAGVAHSLANKDTVSLSGQVQQFWLGDASYRQAYGAIGQYTHMLKDGSALSLSAQVFHFNFTSQPLLDANRYAVALTYAERQFVASISGGKEKTSQRAGDTQSNANDALFLVKRHDERIDVSAGLKYQLSDKISVRPRVTYARNFSNIPIYDYQRVTVSAGVRFEF